MLPNGSSGTPAESPSDMAIDAQLRMTMELIVKAFRRSALLPPLASFSSEAELEQLDWGGRTPLWAYITSLRDNHETVTLRVVSPGVTLITAQDGDEAPALLVDVWVEERIHPHLRWPLTSNVEFSDRSEIGVVSLGDRFFDPAKAAGIALSVRTAWHHPVTTTALVLHRDGMTPAEAVTAALALEE